MESLLVKLWGIFSVFATIFGVVGYFQQYPLHVNIDLTFMNSNYILMLFGVIGILSLFILLFLWIRNKIQSFNSMLYNHAQNIMEIKQCYKREKNVQDLPVVSFIDPDEINGILFPSKEQTSNNSKARKENKERSMKNYPHLFDEHGNWKK